MSMPKFPEIDPEITSEHALNMILASIAMEELALSHIINAEGEKLQYVLGTLETSCGRAPNINEILNVNQSVACILDSVLQNQMILKNKMDKALDALSDVSPRHPDPSCPPTPPCPPDHPGSSCIWPCKCSTVLRAAEKCRIWRPDTALHWNIEHLHGRCVCLDPCDKTKIELCSKGRFGVNFSINVRAKGCKCNAVVSLQLIKKHQCKDIYTVHSQIPCDDEAVTISMGGIIIENYDHASSVLFRLESSDSLMIDDSMLSIMEI